MALNTVMMSVHMLLSFMLGAANKVIVLSVIMLNAVMLNVVMLSVMVAYLALSELRCTVYTLI